MFKKLNKDTLEQALTLLAEKLEFDHAEPASLVVCGGSSLIALGLVMFWELGHEDLAKKL